MSTSYKFNLPSYLQAHGYYFDPTMRPNAIGKYINRAAKGSNVTPIEARGKMRIGFIAMKDITISFSLTTNKNTRVCNYLSYLYHFCSTVIQPSHEPSIRGRLAVALTTTYQTSLPPDQLTLMKYHHSIYLYYIL